MSQIADNSDGRPDFAFGTRKIAIFRGERCLLSGLDLEVSGGDLVHLVGPNGCGKTSLLRVLAGLAQPESGDVLWQGRPIREQLSCFHQNIAWLGHRAGLKGDLSLAENLTFDAALRQSAQAPSTAHLLERLGIAERADVAARGLSAGQRRRTALCRVLMSAAPLWLLDEPFTNLDANGQALVRELLVAHSRAGGAAIFAAHSDVSLDGVTVRRFEWQADG